MSCTGSEAEVGLLQLGERITSLLCFMAVQRCVLSLKIDSVVQFNAERAAVFELSLSYSAFCSRFCMKSFDTL